MKHRYKPGAKVKIIFSFNIEHVNCIVQIIKPYNKGYKLDGVYKYYITSPIPSPVDSTYYNHEYLELIE